MAVKYDRETNYQAEINKAVAKGDYASAKILEQQRNAKIAGEGIKDYSMSTTFQNFNPSPATKTVSYTPTSPSYMTGDAMAKNLGIDYNYKNILNKLNAATTDEYALKNKEYATTENQFYNQMYGAQGTALDTIRKSQAQAIATGASRGLQSANELASMLGLQQETVASATDLAQQRNMLKDKEAGAYTQNVVDATNTYNTLGTTFGNLINNKYAADVQNNVGIMEYFKGLDQNASNLQGTMYAADRGLEGTKDYNDKYLQGVDMTSGRNLQGQLDYNQTYLQASKAQAEATKYAANVNASAQKAYYDSMNAQSPDDIFKLLNNAKTEDEYVLAIVGGSQGHISVDMAKEFWKNRKIKAANDVLSNTIMQHFGIPQVPTGPVNGLWGAPNTAQPTPNSASNETYFNRYLVPELTDEGYIPGSFGQWLYNHNFVKANNK